MKLFNFLLVLTCFVTYAQTPYFENDTIALSEVVITAQKKAMKITPHKTVLDLSNKAVFSPKLLSAIQIVPGIRIDKINRVVSFENKEVQLYVDGRLINIPSESVYAYIQSLPTNDIKSIEFNANPGAKYDAAHNGAIISIRTHKAKEGSLGFNPYVDLSKHTYWNSNYGGSLFGNYKKFSFAVSYDDYFEKVFNDRESTDVFFKNNTTDYTKNGATHEISKGHYQNINATLGYKSGKNKFILSYLRNATTPSRLEGTDSTTLLQNGNSTTTTTYKENRYTDTNNAFSGEYTLHIDTLGSALKLFFDHTEINQDSDMQHRYVANSLSEKSTQLITAKNRLNTFKIDYNNSEEATYQLELGAKYAFTKSDFHNRLTAFNNYLFAIDERIYSSYLSISRQWEQWNATIGLRSEYTDLKGNYSDLLSGAQSPLHKDAFKLFPNLFVEYLWKDNSIALIADSKIQRPGYGQYSPLLIKNDAYSASQGSPTLRSAAVYNYSLKYSFRKRFSFALVFANIKDQISDIVTSNQNNLSISQPINLDEARYYALNTGGSFDLTRWWEINYWAQLENGSKRGSLGNRVIEATIKNNYYISVNHSFKLPRKYMLTLTSYLSGNNTWGGIYTQENLWGKVSLNLKKTFLSDKLHCELVVDDLFETDNKIRASYSDAFYRTHFKNTFPGRTIGVVLSYNFNTNISKVEIDTDTEEKNRINKF